MAIHNKCEELLALRPDVALLQECASPAIPSAQPIYSASSSHAWTGKLATKGLAVLGFGAWTVAPLRAGPRGDLSLPVRVQGPQSFTMLALWTQGPGYVSEAHASLDSHAHLLSGGPLVVAGDLNSNSRWDRQPPRDRHSQLVHRLDDIGLFSAYHAHYHEDHGAESRPTLFMHRHRQKPYHVDYVFVPKAWQSLLRGVDVGDSDRWLQWSDHMPVIVDVAL
jgi:exodeoxyribonuclease-3